MSKAAYPGGADVASYLMAMDLDVDGLDLDAAAKAGSAAFERQANRVMLAVGPSVRVYDPPTARNGILSIDDCASLTGVVYQPASGAGVPFVAGTDYWALPYDAGAKGLPVTQLRFWLRWAAPLSPFLREAIQVTGLWGYGQTLSEDVWTAMIQASCLVLFPQLVQRITQGAAKVIRPGGSTVWFEHTPLASLRSSWVDNLQRVVGNVRRVEIGGYG